MVTTELEASTLDESQVPELTPIRHQEYCYFQFKENPRIATQSSSFLSETLRKYQVFLDADDVFIVTISGSGQKKTFGNPLRYKVV
jgi:hypothetical protein